MKGSVSGKFTFISGVGIALIGAHDVLYANAAAFVVSALCKIPIRLRGDRTSAGTGMTFPAFYNDLRVGLRFVFVQQRIALYLMILIILYNVASTGFIFLLPVIAKDVLHVGARELGFIWSALGVGMLITSAWLAGSKQQALCNRFWLISGAAVIAGIAILSIHAVDSPWTAAL